MMNAEFKTELTSTVTTGFFEEAPGEFSMMRLMSLICLLAGIAMAFIWLLGTPAESDAGLVLTGLFLGFAFFPKVMQKFVENMIATKGKAIE